MWALFVINVILVRTGSELHKSRCVSLVLAEVWMWPESVSVLFHPSADVSPPVFIRLFLFASLRSSATVSLSLCLLCLSVRPWIRLPALPASLQSHSRDFFFLGWAGSDGVRVLRNSSPIIPRCLAQVAALFVARTHLHKHTCIHAHTLRTLLGKVERVFVSLGSWDTRLSP